jgi:hypothetical protein
MNRFIHLFLLTTPLFGLNPAIALAQGKNPDSISTGTLSVADTARLHPFAATTELADVGAIAPSTSPDPLPSASRDAAISKAARDLRPVATPPAETVTAQAETSPPAEKPAAPAEDTEANTEKLAQAAQNPIASLISVPFQNNFAGNIGPLNQTQYVLNVQPVIPVSLSPKWLVVTRTIVPIVNQPGLRISPSSDPNLPPELQTTYTFGLGDINPQFYFVPKTNSNITWGIGPQFIFPTATTTATGAGKWSVGPVGVVVYTHAQWVIGALATQAWSFAGDSDRSSVSQFLVQPFVNYNLPKGWYFTTSPQITANWIAAPGNQWAVPLGGGFGRLFRVGKQPINANLQAYGFVVRPENGPTWLLRFQVQLLFPTGG